MNNQARETSVPQDSRIASRLAGSDFHDAWCIESSALRLSALEHFILAVRAAPKWIDTCMAIRNRSVALLGLKNLGALSKVAEEKSASQYRPGDRVGIFTLQENHFDEVLLGDNDKHLNVVLSVHRQVLADRDRVMITVTTVVHVHNTLGRLYMVPVKPMHRLITPSVLKAISRVINAA